MKLSKGDLCIIKTTDQEVIIGSYTEEGSDFVTIEQPYSILFQEPLDDGHPPRIYLSKYNMFGNNRFTTLSKYSIITLYESSETINTLYAHYLKLKLKESEQIKFINLSDDDEYDSMNMLNNNNSNTTIH